jgi:post-segregation antitoxin (ccd killing protein)
LILTLVCYFLFYTNIYVKKEAWATKKAILANISCLHAKSAAKQADRPKELAWHAEKALPGEGISR